jgi:dTDP-4-amino-4,6-dideoxygalactose transaminase
MRVPFVDLTAQYHAHKQEFDNALASVIAKTAFIGGEFVRQFEADYCRYYGVRNCVSCANGTDAIYIVLRMLGIGPGDEVITSAISWISTAEVISQAGARPVFVDVDEHGLMDVGQIEAKVTSRTRAVIPVHLYGQAVNMTAVADICRRHDLRLIEDCAQAHFAEWRGQRVGTFGDAATFSFYPGKNLGAWGDAGAIITASDDLAIRCRMNANHGALVKHQHEMTGINSRLDGLQAALLSAKLPYVEAWTSARQRVATTYDSELAGVPGLSIPAVRSGGTNVYHLYVVRTAARDQLKEHLARGGVESAIHYPRALPFLPAYDHLGHSPDDFPTAARLPNEVLSLPMYPELTDDMIHHVVNLVREVDHSPRRGA